MEEKNNTPILSFAIAKEIYKSESGYRVINNFLSRKMHKGQSSYLQEHLITSPNSNTYNKYKIEEIIKVFLSGFKPSNKNEIYYRGGSKYSRANFKSETFISLSEDIQQAKSYIDNESGCCIYIVNVDKDVRRIRYSTESEIVLEPGCFWECVTCKQQNGKTNMYNINVYPPDYQLNFPLRGNVIKELKNKEKEESKKVENYIFTNNDKNQLKNIYTNGKDIINDYSYNEFKKEVNMSIPRLYKYNKQLRELFQNFTSKNGGALTKIKNKRNKTKKNTKRI